MLDILMRWVSTRQYKSVIPAMADTLGMSKSRVSWQTIEASEAEVAALLSRRFDEVKLVIIFRLHYIIAWQPPTSSRVRTPAFALELAESAAGMTVAWSNDGWPQLSWRRKRISER